MKYIILWIVSGLWASSSFALSWQDAWQTPDQQAQALMQKKAYHKAEGLFKTPAWQATAAYRAKHFEHAAQLFGKLGTAQGYYNQGNALAQLKRYQAAINAYNKALTLKPHDADTLFNRKLMQQLLKQQSQDKPSQDKESQDKQPEDKQPQDKASQDKPSQDKPSQDKPSQDKPSQDKPSQDKPSQDKPSQDKPSQDKESQDKESQDKESQDKPSQSAQLEKQSAAAQTQDALLDLIPDAPEGLLKETFRRDYLQRQGAF